jgi:hypothetical protein
VGKEPSSTSRVPAGRSRRRVSTWTRRHRAGYLPLVASILLIFEVTSRGVRNPPVFALVPVLEQSAGSPIAAQQPNFVGHQATETAFAGRSNSDLAFLSGGEHARQPTCGLRINATSGFIARRTRTAPEGKHRPRISAPRVVTGAASGVKLAGAHGPEASSARAAID